MSGAVTFTTALLLPCQKFSSKINIANIFAKTPTVSARAPDSTENKFQVLLFIIGIMYLLYQVLSQIGTGLLRLHVSEFLNLHAG